MNDDKNIPRNNKPKDFYSVNLTEGRVIIIFIAIILFIAVVFFGVFIFISQTNKNKVVQTENVPTTKSNDYTFYSDLSGEKNTSSVITETTSDKTTKNEITSVPKKTENKSKVAKNEDLSVVEVDNSEVLLSSKSKVAKKPENKTDSKNIAEKKEDKKVVSKESTKKFVVQVGSYSSKKIADDISAFYQKEKYPTYIKPIVSNGKTFYRLRIGPFADKEKAEKYLATLKESKYGKNSYISVIMSK